MTVRSSALVLAAATLGAMACNSSKLVAAAACPTSGSSAATNEASPSSDLPARAHVPPAFPHVAAASAADATPASAQQLLDAMDVSVPVTGLTLRDVNMQGAAFNGLGNLHAAAGSSFAWLSTGVAGAGSVKNLDPNNPFAWSVQMGNDFGVASPACGTDAHDCAQLEFSFIVPDNAHSIAFDFNFMSAEYPEFVNLGFNDTFSVAMSSPGHTYDNIVFDHQNHPINIDNAFFTQPCGELTGSGFDLLDLAGACDAGGTGLLTTQAPVNPGETVKLTFTIHDTTDGIYDSAVMLDNFRFDTTNVPTPNTDPCAAPTP